MEQFIIVDGTQFMITTDRPLTQGQIVQITGQIREDIRTGRAMETGVKKSGCGCGQKAMQYMTPEGEMASLPFGNDGPGTNAVTSPKTLGSTVNFAATPSGGIAPYTVRFWMSLNGLAMIQVGTTHSGLLEGQQVTDDYVIVGDISQAIGNPGALSPTGVNVTTGVIDSTGGSSAPIAPGSIRFYTSIVDSCTVGGGAGTSAQFVDVALTCMSPTCDFVVS